MRKHFVTASCVIVLCFTAESVTAQTGHEDKGLSAPDAVQKEERSAAEVPDPGKRPVLRSFVRDEWRLWTSPFRRSNYDAPAVKKYIIPFALISTGLIATDRKIANVLPNTNDQEVWSGRISQIGSAYSMAGLSGTMYQLGKATGNAHARETGWIAMEAIAHTQLVVLGIKQLTNRRRPITREVRGGFWNGGDSFPSGHAATSFAVASVFAYEYRHHIAVPITAFSLASLVSASRVSARRHWASDIFVGGSTGFLIGRYMYKRNHDPKLPGSPVNRTRARRLVPEIGFGATGATLSWRL
jgi:membrane-associated phospholipid phosphatase